MCGIAGFIDPSMHAGAREDVLESMLEMIAHRGPDARGKYLDGPMALGQNRLSIIDLSADSNQPMERNGNYIVYNGEVYNYREIRKELEQVGVQFKTSSDTEVIMAAYEAYGPRCVERFVGMWAFALWDAREQHLFCSRDRFGIKPFFYFLQGEGFYFGSEYKAFFPVPGFTKELNKDMVYRGLQLGWNAWYDETYYKRLQALPPAQNLIFKPGSSPVVKRYWDIDTAQQQDYSYEEATVVFRTAFQESMQLHMRSDVEVGACLSGGIDSSAIASVVGRDFENLPFKTFTVYYEGQDEVDERPWVRKVLDAYPSLQPFYFTPGDDEIRAEFSRAIWHADVPLAGSSPLSQYFVMQLASRQRIKVLLDGQGSDEMLGGYMHSFYRLLGEDFRKLRWMDLFSEWNAHSSLQGFGAAKKTDLLLKSVLAGMQSEQQLYALEYKKYLTFLPKDNGLPFRLHDKEGTRLNQFLYQLTFASSLPTLLQFEDRNSMAFSIESRVPFLDHRLVELAFRLPDSAKISKGVTKRVLRDALKGILPEAIAGRRDKKGFVTPGEVKWLRGPLSFLLDEQFSDIDFLNQSKVREVLADFKRGDNRQANLVWRLAVLRYWMDN